MIKPIDAFHFQIGLSVPASDGFLRFGHQTMLTNTWTHSAKCTGEKSQMTCALGMGIPYLPHGGKDLTATGTTMPQPTMRSAWIFRRFAEIKNCLKLIFFIVSLLDQTCRSIPKQFVTAMKS